MLDLRPGAARNDPPAVPGLAAGRPGVDSRGIAHSNRLDNPALIEDPEAKPVSTSGFTFEVAKAFLLDVAIDTLTEIPVVTPLYDAYQDYVDGDFASMGVNLFFAGADILSAGTDSLGRSAVKSSVKNGMEEFHRETGRENSGALRFARRNSDNAGIEVIEATEGGAKKLSPSFYPVPDPPMSAPS